MAAAIDGLSSRNAAERRTSDSGALRDGQVSSAACMTGKFSKKLREFAALGLADDMRHLVTQS
jgi:hypothetical protein